MFVPGSDLTPLQKNMDKIIDGLTGWQPRTKERAAEAPPRVKVEGEDYDDAMAKMNLTFLRNKWGDGLPIVPATEARVRWLLTGTDLPRDTVVGTIPPIARVATVESLAVALAMTGGRPEYMPVLIAAIQAFVDPRQRAAKWQATTANVCPAVIVNGPIGRQIRLNSRHGCLGPDPAHPAGGCIGRAIRLIQQDIGGAVPGSGTMSIYGGPARYTNVVFAEDEEGLPADWEPTSVERGFPAGSNIVTMHVVGTYCDQWDTFASTKEQVHLMLDRYAAIMSGDFASVFTSYSPESSPGVALMPRETARDLSALGWSKGKVKDYLWENSKIPVSRIKSFAPDIYRRAVRYGMESYVAPGEPWPLAASPKNIRIVVAGGAARTHGYWMRMGFGPYSPTSAEIRLPERWQELLAKAAEELGPIPEDN